MHVTVTLRISQKLTKLREKHAAVLDEADLI